MMPLYNAGRIKEAIRDAGFTQDAVAKALNKSRPTIIKLCKGQCNDISLLWAVVDLVKLKRTDVV